MTSAQHRYRIVVPLDHSEYSEIVLEHAIDQAARHTTADLHFLTVVAKESELEDAKVRLATEVLQALDTPALKSSDWRSRLHVTHGDPVEEIASLAADLRADLLVIGRFGTHDRGKSIADRVLAHATCPTLVVGLTERTFDAQAQCAQCVAVREESDGERWFCEAHTGERHFTALLPSTALGSGSLMW
ncbi:MAG: universal stress protein [Myxococcales bacterium]|nr:universal stress protein [Myxococcales bacterium]